MNFQTPTPQETKDKLNRIIETLSKQNENHPLVEHLQKAVEDLEKK
jgi:hypothetical protein